jgi:Tol biopolymer transport system component
MADGLKGKILYTSDDGKGTIGHATIYVIDSINRRWISPSITGLAGIKWSPDGSEFVYSSQGDIYTMNSDGSDKKKLLEHKFNEFTDPDWSPDGTKIAFVVTDEQYLWPHNCFIYTMNNDGSGIHKLVEGLSATWSHDGKKIIFQKYDSLIYSINISDHSIRKLTDIHSIRGEIALSPDETRVLYTLFNSTYSAENIFIENLDGSGRQQLTNSSNNGEYNKSPCWSPDGTKIAFGWNQYLCIMNADGSSKVLVDEIPASGISYVDWYR